MAILFGNIHSDWALTPDANFWLYGVLAFGVANMAMMMNYKKIRYEKAAYFTTYKRINKVEYGTRSKKTKEKGQNGHWKSKAQEERPMLFYIG